MLQQLANLGSFLGGIGVLLTVVYLAVQLRVVIKTTRGATYQAVVGAISDWTRDIGIDSNATRILFAGLHNPTMHSVEETFQFNLMLTSVVRNFENIHYQYLTGGIAKETWTGWCSRIQSIMQMPGVSAWWGSNKQFYSPQFGEFVLEALTNNQQAVRLPTDA